MKVSIIKYNAGNIQSVLFALERIGINATVTDNPEVLSASDKVIFPGVGEASSAMNYLKERKLDEVITSLKQPVLGICLGMQLLCSRTEEGNTNCLGIFNTQVKLFPQNIKDVKIPQIGWNTIFDLQTELNKDLNENAYMYFVHSYYAEIGEHTISKTKHGIEYSSALKKDNFYGAQFHPEKSGNTGQKLLENFIKLI